MHIKAYNVQIGFGHCIIVNIHLFSILTLPWLRSVLAASQSPGQRANHCAVVIQDSMFIFGGIADNNSSYFSQVSLPFSSTSQWSSLPMTGAVQVSKPACVVTQDNKLLVIGGTALAQTSDTFSFLQLYDPNTQTWSVQNTNDLYPFRSMQGHVAVTTRNAIFVFNGNAGLDPTYLLQYTGQNSWEVIQYPLQQYSPPANLIYPSVTSVSTSGDRVFIIGGEHQDGTISTQIYAFDVASTSWLPENQSVQPTCANCTIFATNNGEVIDVISPGSSHPVQSLSLSQGQFPNVVGVELINSSIPQPKSPSSFPVPLKGYSAATFNQSVYIYGGITADNSTSDTIYQFDTLTKDWSIPAENPMSSNTSSTNNNASPNSSNSPNSPQYTTGSSTSSKLALIFGCGIGILAFIALVCLIIYWLRVKREKRAQYLTSNDSQRISSVALEGYTLGRGKGLDGNANDVAFVSGLLKRLSLLNKKNATSLVSSEDAERLQSSVEVASVNSGHLDDDTNDNSSVSGPAMLERSSSGVANLGNAV